MIVFKSPFPREITPWNISGFILFWLPDEDERVEKLGDFLAFGNNVSDRNNTLFYNLLRKINNSVSKIDYVKVHGYDLWNGDETLIDIIYPILLEYKNQMNGSPNVDDEDVPDELKSYKSFKDDDKVHEKWSYVVDEMIFAFDPKNNDYMDSLPDKELNKRLENGRMLFGKYLTSLWT